MIKQTYKIAAPVSQVWAALTEPKIIEKWSGNHAVMDAKEGSKFKLWGGDIWGINSRMIKNKLIEQDWYGGKWSKPSKVSIELKAEDGSTTVQLTHKDVPAGEEKNFDDGWKNYYFGPMKELLEN